MINEIQTRKKKSQWHDVWKRFRKNKAAMSGLIVITILVLSAIFANVIAPEGFDEQNLTRTFQPPSREHLMGTDNLGRDQFSRIIFGTRTSLQVGFVAVSIAMVIGSLIGAIAGFFGGKVDNIIMRFVDILLAIPGILLAIAIASALGTGMTNLMIAVGISAIPSYARIVRSAALSVREQEFIEAARAMGGSDTRIIMRHVLPNCMAPIIVQVTLGLAGAILSAAGLSFIGLGIMPPTPEWGSMLNVGRRFIRDHWFLTVFPGLAIVTVVLAFNLVGDGLRDALDPKLKK
ncbi:MAG: ABC transporter permease [Spirochaetes bacterium]|nr:ABC transporter permease [Spirochaetota bacterium]